MTPMNIFVVHPSEMLTDHLPNGEGWIAYNYLRGLAERGHTLHVAVPRIEMRDPLPSRLHLHRVPKEEGLLGRLRYMWAVRRLFGELRRSVPFDIVQQFTPVETGLSLSVLGSGVPLVLGPYPSYWPDEAFRSFKPNAASLVTKLKQTARVLLAFIQQAPAKALIVTCPAGIDRVISRIARRKRTHVVGPGIHSKLYVERTHLPDKPSILFLANLEYWKGIFTLLTAFEQVADAVPDCTLEIWGDGTEAMEVDRHIQQSRFNQRIHRHGRALRQNVADVMRAHSVYCLPSYGEPFGMTLLEAMACGVPVVATDAGGPPHIVRQTGGRIVPMRQTEALASALIEILSNLELQRSMGAYNRRRVEQEFDWSRSLDRMEDVYKRVLSGKAHVSSQWAKDVS